MKSVWIKGAVIWLFLLLVFSSLAAAQEQSGNHTGQAEAIGQIQQNEGAAENSFPKQFVNKMLTYFKQQMTDSDFQLKVPESYSVQEEGGSSKVTLDPFYIENKRKKENFIKISPFTMKFQEMDDDLVKIDFILPEKISFMDGQKEEGTLTYDSHHFSGIWSKDLDSFISFEGKWEKVLLQDDKKTFQMGAELWSGSYNLELTKDETKRWIQDINGVLKSFSVILKDDINKPDVNFSIDKIALNGRTTGWDFKKVNEAKDSFSKLIHDADNLKVQELSQCLASLDVIHKLVDKSKMEFSLEKMVIEKKKGFKSSIGSIRLTGEADLDVSKKKEKVRSKAVFTDLVLEPQNRGPNIPRKLALGQLRLNYALDAGSLPPDFFTRIGKMIEEVDGLKDKKKKNDLIGKYIKDTLVTVFKRFDRLSAEVGFKDGLYVFDDGNATKEASLGSAWFSAALDLPEKKNRALRLSTGYTKLVIPILEKYFNGANIRLQLANIPSFLALLDDKSFETMKDNFDVFLQQMGMGLMKMIEKEPVTLNLMVALSGIPSSMLNLDLVAKSNLKAAFKATGMLDLTIENPENMTQIASYLAAAKEGGESGKRMGAMTSQLLQAYMPLLKTEKRGDKVIGSLNVQITPDGKIILNNKDVTEMFLGGAKGKKQGKGTGAGTGKGAVKK